ncbi:precorrin-6Y C5,15-methyltransferase (decarboxylating) subunit CbiT [Tissierella sp. MSJ-40]|uniref:Precorrin-6Y C5,15-methyltransferase (Decarboxylating) subunit CbiT n=1 Tax=Tissierella simiarum TaxID=2841534 RepID=A0ABS6E3G6_9FIRM|nr:precorrin-6Y C5,15-methyltransferase (decarboxylating) subunit CbiT [Tissierella simiarum]MBU5437443.1 precorrin-6Y C5,15-methyltransferase (decarboxylating) subunit CbiT [Tissierella simiarum]
MKWIKDKEFIRGNVPMTKFNIRVLTLAYLNISLGDRLLDIGAGTGSVSIEGALQGARVWAIEKEEEGIELIDKNCKKFNAEINLIKGVAPKDLPDLKFSKCFIGGSGGRMEEIFKYLNANLEMDGIVCGNFITIKNLNQFINLLKEYKYKDIEVELIQSSSMDDIGLMKGSNPIFIGKGVKI